MARGRRPIDGRDFKQSRNRRLICVLMFQMRSTRGGATRGFESGFEVHDSGERERRGVTARAREKGARTQREKPFVEVGFDARRRRER